MDDKTRREAIQFVLDHPTVSAQRIATEFDVSWAEGIEILVEADFILDLTPNFEDE